MRRPALQPLTVQADRLINLGLIADPDSLRARAVQLELTAPAGGLLVLHEHVLPAHTLVPHLRLPAPGRAGRRGRRVKASSSSL